MFGLRVKTNTTGITAVAKLAKRREITLKAVRAGAKLLERAVKRTAPKASGALRVAQGIKAKKGRKGKTVSFAVQGAKMRTVKMVRRPGSRSTKRVKAVPGNYDHLVNLGVRPHRLGTGASLGRTAGRGRAAVKKAQFGKLHPGVKATKFRKRAWAEVKRAAGSVILAVMVREVRKAIAEQSAAVQGGT